MNSQGKDKEEAGGDKTREGQWKGQGSYCRGQEGRVGVYSTGARDIQYILVYRRRSCTRRSDEGRRSGRSRRGGV